MCEREQFSAFYNHLVWMSIFLIRIPVLLYHSWLDIFFVLVKSFDGVLCAHVYTLLISF
jgi:hypothetical protein